MVYPASARGVEATVPAGKFLSGPGTGTTLWPEDELTEEGARWLTGFHTGVASSNSVGALC